MYSIGSHVTFRVTEYPLTGVVNDISKFWEVNDNTQLYHTTNVVAEKHTYLNKR